MQTLKVAKWGNSLAVRLPARLVADLEVKEGDGIRVTKHNRGEMEIVRANEKEDALAHIAALRWKVPEGFKFDRDEANER
ncbi:MAG: AbrB/MazE/SpoVT family DNA-binding domain-containing protein [Sphingomonadaceae bacterium]